MSKNCNTEKQYQQNKEKLLALINSKVRNKEDSEDILQETFIQFEECCQKKCECDYPKSYLFKMALNNISDFFRGKKRKNNLEQNLEKKLEVLEKPHEFPCDVYQCTYQFLSKLSLENQEAFIKSDIENIPQKQIAQDLNLPISTLKSRVQRTRTYLKKEFETCLKKY